MEKKTMMEIEFDTEKRMIQYIDKHNLKENSIIVKLSTGRYILITKK
jgi:hypothetical protein